MSLKYIFFALISLLLLPIQSVASSLKDTISIGFDTYNDTGDVQVYSPTLSLLKKASQHWMLGVKMRIDAISAASIKNGANGGQVDIVTGASRKEGQLYDDIRYAPTLSMTYSDGDNTLSFGGYYSSEQDYDGKSLFCNYTRQLNQENTTLNIGVSQSFDRWHPVFDRALPRSNRNETKIDLSINQLITPKFSLQLVNSYMYSQGFLSSPYHYISQNNLARFENYPAQRTGDAISLKGVALMNKDNALNFSYRYYIDDWNIRSHTFNVEELHDVTRDFTSGLRLRYYTQTKSNFVKEIGTYNANDKYFAVDYRMSAFDSIDVGLPFIYHPNRTDKLTASIDYYQTTNNNYIKRWYGVNNLKAVYTTLTYTFGY